MRLVDYVDYVDWVDCVDCVDRFYVDCIDYVEMIINSSCCVSTNPEGMTVL
jgi:hypothetical protein